MRVAMLSPVAPAHGRGGVQDIVWMLCRGLAARGHSVTLLTTARADGVTREESSGVVIEYLAGTPPMRPIGVWAHASRRRVAALHAEQPLEAIHSQSFCGLHLIGAFPGVGVTASPHGTHVDELRTRAGILGENLATAPLEAAKAAVLWTLMLGRYLSEGPALKRCAAVIATSVEQRAVLLERYRVPPARLHDVWNGIDTALFAPRPADPELRARLGAAPGAPLVLAVARLYQEKGLQHALRAWPRVLAKHPNAVFAIVGDGPYRGTLEAQAAALGIAASVRFTGVLALEALPAAYASCDVFVNPTVRINGYDLTILQAMAAGKPVVVSNLGSVPTAVADRIDGLLAPPGDAEALAARLLEAIDDPALAARLGAAALAKVRERFSLDAMVEGTLAVYRQAALEVRA